MGDALLWHRLQFAFTAVYHYVFPQLTMGLAPVIVFLRWRREERLAEFLTRVFAINFAFGVVTGFPMEFQFGTNWAGLARYAGDVIGQTLAMEGMFAFFLESIFLGVLLWSKPSPKQKLGASIALWAGSWLSAYFILATHAFTEHPQGFVKNGDKLQLDSLADLLLSRWAWTEVAHTLVAALVTGAFVLAAMGAYYTLSRKHREASRLRSDGNDDGKRLLEIGTTLGLVASFAVAFPTGDQQAKLVAHHQEPALAAMEGRFESGQMADITLIGQPNVPLRRLDNPIRVPGALSFLAYGTFHGDVRGLASFPEDEWPQNIELLYYAFHLMAGIGTLMIGIMSLAVLQRFRKKLQDTRPLLWALMLAFPLPYIANTAGWITAELGRQPWVIYGILRTRDATSTNVHSGDVLFTLIGFCGLYLLLGLLFVFLIGREILRGPGDVRSGAEHGDAASGGVGGEAPDHVDVEAHG